MKHETISGIIMGTLWGLQSAWHSIAHDLFYAVLMAGIGATTSFFVTMVLKWLIKYFKR